MITYRPDYIVSSAFGHCVYDPKAPHDFLPLYEHFARKVLDWKLPREVLNDTSSINNSEFDPLGSQQQAQQTLAKLFLMAGTDCGRGAFLRRCGIRRWADLAKPICVEGRPCKRCFAYSITYDVCERKLTAPGPNPCYPWAVYAQSASFHFGAYDRLWHFDLSYGYSRDSSSWDTGVVQGRKESLRTFMDETVPKWLEERLEPEWDSGPRQQRNRDYVRLTSAVAEVFAWECGKRDLTIDALVDSLLGVDGYALTAHRMSLTGRRLGTLRRWMRADARREKP